MSITKQDLTLKLYALNVNITDTLAAVTDFLQALPTGEDASREGVAPQGDMGAFVLARRCFNDGLTSLFKIVNAVQEVETPETVAAITPPASVRTVEEYAAWRTGGLAEPVALDTLQEDTRKMVEADFEAAKERLAEAHAEPTAPEQDTPDSEPPAPEPTPAPAPESAPSTPDV